MSAFDGMETFARVVEAGGFTAAAAQLGVTKSSVSETVRRLEDRLGVRLLDRTTRRVTPTVAGDAFYLRCRKALEEATAARAEALALHVEPRGRLRVAAPEAFTRLLIPVLPELLQLSPDLQVEFVAGVQAVDLVEHGFDLAIRIAPQPADNLIVRRIGTSRVVIVGTPEYLERCGEPQSPDELSAHRCIGFSPLFWGREWRFEGPDGPLSVPIRPVLSSNMAADLREGVLAHIGLTAMPEWAVAEDLASGAMKRVLSAWKMPESGIYAVYPSNRLMAVKVKLFVDHVARRLRRLGL